MPSDVRPVTAGDDVTVAAPPGQSFLSRLAGVLTGELVSKASVIGAFLWLARALDPAVYGEIEWALALMMVATLVADGGLTTWGAAEIAARPERARQTAGRIGALRFALAVPTYCMLLGVALSYGGRAGLTLAVYGLTLFLTPFFLQYLFNGLFRSSLAGLGNAVRGLTFAAVVLLFVRPGSPPWIVAAAEVMGGAALAICSLLLLRRVMTAAGTAGPVRGTAAAGSALASERTPGLTHFRDLRAILARSWSIGATEVTWGVHWYAGLILLGYLATPTEAAWHSAALRLVMALHTGVWLYLYVLLPNLARLLTDDVHGWRRLVQQSLRLTGWAGWAIALVGTLAADTILTTVFGAPYIAAIPVLQAAIWVVPIAWMSGHIRYSLIAAQHPRRDYRAGLIGAAFTILLSLLLIPGWRSTGTGLALLGGTLANAAAAWALGRAVLPRVAFGASILPSTAAGLACLALGWLCRPFLGEVGATSLAATLFAAVALVTERETMAAVFGNLTKSTRLKVGDANARS